jgi:hypothetical protein
VKVAIAGLPVLFLLAWGILYIPFPPKLELYDIPDLTQSNRTGSFPGGMRSLHAEPEEFALIVGESLTRRLKRCVPGLTDGPPPRSIDIEPGLLIVRATRPQQVAVHAAIAFTRAFAR